MFPSPDVTCSCPNLSVLPFLYITLSCLCFTVRPSWTSLGQCTPGRSPAGKDVVSRVDRLPDRDSAVLSGPVLSDTTAYRATVLCIDRLSVAPIRDNQADFPLSLHSQLLSCFN